MMNQLSRSLILGMLASLLPSLPVATSVPARAQIAPAHVEKIDLATWTCQRFLDANNTDINMMISWLDGYYKHENDPPIIDTGEFYENSRKLKEYCTAHADMGFVAATDTLFGRD
jgi:acid stress chaperone HdeB